MGSERMEITAESRTVSSSRSTLPLLSSIFLDTASTSRIIRDPEDEMRPPTSTWAGLNLLRLVAVIFLIWTLVVQFVDVAR